MNALRLSPSTNYGLLLRGDFTQKARPSYLEVIVTTAPEKPLSMIVVLALEPITFKLMLSKSASTTVVHLSRWNI
jgi:hypothetical protein